MIWHIFRKDWKLLRWYVLGVALVNLAYRVVLSNIGPFQPNRVSPLANASSLLATIGPIVTALLVLLVVQQDAIPGLRQDWIVRPLARKDLLLSKMLFVILLIQGPILIIEIGQGLAAGFPLTQVLGPALSRNIWALLALDLPILAFATLTRNLMEAVGASVVVVLGFALFTTWATQGPGTNPAEYTDFAWVVGFVRLVWGLAGVAVVLLLQYFRRKTLPSRWVSAGALAVWMLAQLLPWQTAFAVQRQFSPHPQAATPIQISFDTSPQFRPRHGASWQTGRFGRGEVVLSIPLRVAGIPDGELLKADQVTTLLRRKDGKTIDLGTSRGGGGGALSTGTGQAFQMTKDIYRANKDQVVTLEMEYALTLLKRRSSEAVPAVDGHRLLDHVGVCNTRVNEEGGWIELGCFTMGNAPCTIEFIRNPLTGKQDDHSNGCFPSDYAPWFGRLNGDSMDQVARDIHFQGGVTVNAIDSVVFGGSSSDSSRYPVDESQLKDSEVVIQTFQPEAHFTRKLVVPDFRPEDWAWGY